MRVGIADHFGWAIAVTATPEYEVVDRRRIGLIEPDVSEAPIHYESRRLDVAGTAALVARARASIARAAGSAFDEIASALPEPVVSVSLRVWPPDFPEDIAVQRRSPYEARADAIMYRQELAELAHARGWEVHLYDAKAVVDQAVRKLGERGDEVLEGASREDRAAVDEGPPRRARRGDRGRPLIRPAGSNMLAPVVAGLSAPVLGGVHAVGHRHGP